MLIERFYDEELAHASYVVISGKQAAVVDPGRDPAPYYRFAEENGAEITVVFETHPHADFVSSHEEIFKETEADIYVSKDVGAKYQHLPFDDGNSLEMKRIRFKALHTPGHSPDSISIVVEDRKGKDHAVFTGDALFIDDVGRPDLREKAGNMQAKREEMARQMYHTIHNVYMKLDDDVRVMPAHGAGSLCGKNMSDELESTIGEQKENNWAFQEMEEDEFVEQLLEGQPFIPAYFQYDVELNRKGAPNLEESVAAVDRLDGMPSEDQDALYIDARDEELFKKGHIQGALNIQDGKKFETWLGTIVPPHHSWYLITEDEQMQERLIRRAAKIGYEAFLTGAFIYDDSMEGQQADSFSLKDFKAHPETFHIVDVRDHSEVAEEKIFDDAQHIPMDELMEGAAEVPTSKPIVVHCAGGYRSAIAYSILQKELGDQTKVFDLGEAVKEFSEEEVTA